jgi:large subunit ribosomal protein L4
MPIVDVYNIQGTKVGEMNLNDDVFGIEVSQPTLHQAVVTYLAAQRQGTHATKTRAMVSGGGKKPWRQKGTGHARVGSSRSPIWRKGGVTFGPLPRSYRLAMPKRLRRLAMKSALTSKVQAGNLIVLDTLSIQQPKTKEIVSLLTNLKVDKKALFVTQQPDQNVHLSTRNIPGVKALFAEGLNVYDILLCDKMIITKDAVGKVEEVFANA